MKEYQVMENEGVTLEEEFIENDAIVNNEVAVSVLKFSSIFYREQLEILFDTSQSTILYHGTGLERAKRIISDGYIKVADIQEATENYNKTFMTDNFTYASYYGNIVNVDNRYNARKDFEKEYGKSISDVSWSDGIVNGLLAVNKAKKTLRYYREKSKATPTKYIIFEIDVMGQEIYKVINKSRNVEIRDVININDKKLPYYEYYTTNNIPTNKIINIFLVDTGLPEDERVSKITAVELLKL